MDYKSILEFYDIYERNNFNINSNLKNQKIAKYPVPWSISENFYKKEKFEILNEEKNQIENKEEYFNISYLSFLMMEMLTGRNMEFLVKNFKNFSEGDYYNENIEQKLFNFPEEVTSEFINIFYYFFEKKITNQDFENILNHGFFC